MNTGTILLYLTLAGFSLLTGFSLFEVGYLGILRAGLADPGAVQIFADLVIACTLACVWMVNDARRRGANPWPFVAITLAGGSFGPLLYLLRRQAAVGTTTPTGHGVRP